MVRMVKLIDGTEVSSDSEEWRHETEARAVLAMPTKRQRQEYLWGTFDKWGKERGGIRGHRGEEEVKRLQETIIKIWGMRQAANDNDKT
jgi:hypothetical protein